jgi:DNA gyrase subunit A
LVSRGGKVIQFSENDVRVMWRAAAGVRGMNIADSDSLIEACVADVGAKYIFTVTENGIWKISSLDDYREQKRGGSWVKVATTSDKTGEIIGAYTLTEEQKTEGEVILISKSGQTVRLPLSWVKVQSRTTQWVILAKLKDSSDAFISAAVVKKWEWDDTLQQDESTTQNTEEL